MLLVHIGIASEAIPMRQFQCIPTTYVFSVYTFFMISFFKNKFATTSLFQWNEDVEMNKFSCSLSWTWMTIIDCLFYASGSLSWHVSWEYIAKLVVAWLYIYMALDPRKPVLTLCILETPKWVLLLTVKTQMKMLHFIRVYSVKVKKSFRQKNTFF